MFADTLSCQGSKGGNAGISWVEESDAAQHPTIIQPKISMALRLRILSYRKSLVYIYSNL